jgi:predicted RNA-binding protein with PIN domain
VLEAAVAVAREGERSTPPVLAPGPLRRYLSFARLPDPALEVARRVLDDDPEFRARVASAVDADTVGRAGWAYLTRPDGWEAEVDELRQEAAAREAQARDERAERDAQRRLAGAEAAAARAIAAATSANAEADRLRAQLDQERAASAAAHAELDRLRADLVRATDQRAAAIQRVKDLEAAAASRAAELKAVRHELRMAQAELAGTAPDDAQADDAGTPAGAPAGGRERSEPAVDRAAVATAVADALAASDAARAALAAAAALLGQPDGEPAPLEASPADPSAQTGRRAPRPRRRPAALPPGVLDDGVEAAEHLVRVPGALLLVDGYNISNAQWHGLALPEQRARLLDACAELHARCGTEVEVVFDGAGDAAVGTAPRSAVRHRFTPGGEEADDVILARIDEEPIERVVLVASSDRRVRDGARARGANVLGARQVLAVLRR